MKVRYSNPREAIQNPRKARCFGIAQENGHEMLAMERSHPNWDERNILKYVDVLKEYLAPQNGYYGFVLLRDISRDYVFGAWVREIYFWECGCNNFSYSEYFSLVILWQRRWFFSGFRIFHVNFVLCNWCIFHLIFSINLLLDKLLGVILRGSSIS